MGSICIFTLHFNVAFFNGFSMFGKYTVRLVSSHGDPSSPFQVFPSSHAFCGSHPLGAVGWRDDDSAGKSLSRAKISVRIVLISTFAKNTWCRIQVLTCHPSPATFKISLYALLFRQELGIRTARAQVTKVLQN